MISGLLITIDIFVSIALVIVVLMQRSEGGAFGMGGGPTGLVTARGAGDLLTRTTWVLFTVFLVLSLGLSLLGAHDRSQSSVLDRLKLQQINPNVLSRPVAPPPAAATTAPAGPPTQAPAPTAGLLGPPPATMSPLATPAPLAASSGAPAAPSQAPVARPRRVRRAAATASLGGAVSSPSPAPTPAPAASPAAAGAPPTVAPAPRPDTPSQAAPAAPPSQP